MFKKKFTNLLSRFSLPVGLLLLVNFGYGATLNAATINVPVGGNIQQALNSANDGDTIQLAAGAYSPGTAITINKRVTLNGQSQSGTTVQASVIMNAGPGNGRMELTNLSVIVNSPPTYALYIDGSNADTAPVTISNVTARVVGSNSQGRGILIAPHGHTINDVLISDCTFSDNPTHGMHIDNSNGSPGGSVTNLSVSSTSFDNNNFKTSGQRGYGLYIFAYPATDPLTVDGVSFSHCSFSDNIYKGMYIEALSNAVFDDITVNNSGTLDGSHAAGIDINLKFGAYHNITISNSAIINCGLNDVTSNGTGIVIKARDDGSSYGAHPATLDNVLLSAVTITGSGSGAGGAGIRFGEGSPTTGLTNVVMTGSIITNNTPYGAINVNPDPNGEVHDVRHNWWGDISGPLDVVSGDSSIPDTNPNGQGDTIVGALNYFTWREAKGIPTLTEWGMIVLSLLLTIGGLLLLYHRKTTAVDVRWSNTNLL